MRGWMNAAPRPTRWSRSIRGSRSTRSRTRSAARRPWRCGPGSWARARAGSSPAGCARCSATSRDTPFTRPGWVFEIKYDGYRIIGAREGGEAVLWSRNRNDLTATFPEIARAVRGLPFGHVIVDGEVVVHDAAGLPSFARLQKRGRLQNHADIQRAAVELPARMYVFDLLAVGDLDLRGLPLLARKQVLREVLPPAGPLHLLRPHRGGGRGDVRTRHADAPRGHCRQEGGQHLRVGPFGLLDEDPGGGDRGLRRRRLVGAAGRAAWAEFAAPGALRGRHAGARGQRRHGLHGRRARRNPRDAARDGGRGVSGDGGGDVRGRPGAALGPPRAGCRGALQEPDGGGSAAPSFLRSLSGGQTAAGRASSKTTRRPARRWPSLCRCVLRASRAKCTSPTWTRCSGRRRGTPRAT